MHTTVVTERFTLTVTSDIEKPYVLASLVQLRCNANAFSGILYTH